MKRNASGHVQIIFLNSNEFLKINPSFTIYSNIQKMKNDRNCVARIVSFKGRIKKIRGLI